MTPDDGRRGAGNAAGHRLNLIHAAYAHLPATPALEQLFHTLAWDLSGADLEAFCSIPASMREATRTAGRIELATVTEPPSTNPRGCCDWSSRACPICHARGDYRLQVFLADEISLVRGGYARTDPDAPLRTWWVEHLHLECGCHTYRAVSSATGPHWLERCPNHCANAVSSWLSRKVIDRHVLPGGGQCADYTQPPDGQADLRSSQQPDIDHKRNGEQQR